MKINLPAKQADPFVSQEAAEFKSITKETAEGPVEVQGANVYGYDYWQQQQGAQGTGATNLQGGALTGLAPVGTPDQPGSGATGYAATSYMAPVQATEEVAPMGWAGNGGYQAAPGAPINLAWNKPKAANTGMPNLAFSGAKAGGTATQAPVPSWGAGEYGSAEDLALSRAQAEYLSGPEWGSQPNLFETLRNWGSTVQALQAQANMSGTPYGPLPDQGPYLAADELMLNLYQDQYLAAIEQAPERTPLYQLVPMTQSELAAAREEARITGRPLSNLEVQGMKRVRVDKKSSDDARRGRGYNRAAEPTPTPAVTEEQQIRLQMVEAARWTGQAFYEYESKGASDRTLLPNWISDDVAKELLGFYGRGANFQDISQMMDYYGYREIFPGKYQRYDPVSGGGSGYGGGYSGGYSGSYSRGGGGGGTSRYGSASNSQLMQWRISVGSYA
jgi:hypothetical protein